MPTASQTWSKLLYNYQKPVAQGDFKAATILEARPYVAGTLDENYVTLESLGLANRRFLRHEEAADSQPAKTPGSR